MINKKNSSALNRQPILINYISTEIPKEFFGLSEITNTPKGEQFQNRGSN